MICLLQISGVVGEQEVGLRQMLRTMGMLDAAYWLSWMLFEVGAPTSAVLSVYLFVYIYTSFRIPCGDKLHVCIVPLWMCMLHAPYWLSCHALRGSCVNICCCTSCVQQQTL